jgi:hypothetical protein
MARVLSVIVLHLGAHPPPATDVVAADDTATIIGLLLTVCIPLALVGPSGRRSCASHNHRNGSINCLSVILAEVILEYAAGIGGLRV